RTMDIPDSLQEKFDVFRARGEVMARQDELFKETSWYAVLAGQGLVPEGYHPVADAISEDELRLRLTKIRTGIQNRINSMPGHKEFIRKHCRSADATFE
ncbi:MAG: tryptophan 7-halogenase, partial [Woeseiaceae bacterium]